jgi:hypothetical protein
MVVEHIKRAAQAGFTATVRHAINRGLEQAHEEGLTLASQRGRDAIRDAILHELANTAEGGVNFAKTLAQGFTELDEDNPFFMDEE